MQTFLKLFAITVFSATYVAADATIFFTGNTNCAGSGSTQTVPGDGACIELGGINSAITTSVDPGCSVTVYTDSSCSVDATLAGLNQCLTGAPLLSYSYNC